jgi:hypothetical protein
MNAPESTASIAQRNRTSATLRSWMFGMLASVLFSVSCGSEGRTNSDANPPQKAPRILVQPLSKIIGLGQVTTFTVEVESEAGANNTYQWLWNGVEIAGANEPTLSTRPAEVADNGSLFSVTVSNAFGSLSSSSAVLTVSSVPRAPKFGDLRFQGVDAAPFRIPLLHSGIGPTLEVGFQAAAGTPLQSGADVCVAGQAGSCFWLFVVFGLPPTTPLSHVSYLGGRGLAELKSVVAALTSPSIVITSVDLEDLGDSYALSWVESIGGDFDSAQHFVNPADLGTAIAGEGETSRVVTAVSFSAGQAYYLAYGWAHDRTTVYEASVRIASIDTVRAESERLATEGYIITALGQDGAGGLVLVGTRVRGDSAPRPLEVVTGTGVPQDLLARGFAIVGYIFDADTNTTTWIGEQ